MGRQLSIRKEGEEGSFRPEKANIVEVKVCGFGCIKTVIVVEIYVFCEVRIA